MSKKRVVPCVNGCGTELVRPKGRRPHYCAACRDATKAARQAAAWRRWRTKAGYAQGSLDPRPCQLCGAEFERTAHQFNKRYCSDACAQEAIRVKARDRRGYAARNQTQSCARPECGKPFERGPRQHRKLYCSDACAQEARAEQSRKAAKEFRKRRNAKPKRAALFALVRQIYRGTHSTPQTEAA